MDYYTNQYGIWRQIRLILFISVLTIFSNLSAQNLVDTASSRTDTTMLNPDQFTPARASSYIRQLIGKEDLWKEQDDSLKLSLIRLVDHYNEPFESVRTRLERFTFEAVALKLARVTPLKEIPVFWSFGLSSSFSVNWNYLVNWVQGGESSFSGMFDINGRAVYTHKEKTSSKPTAAGCDTARSGRKNMISGRTPISLN